MNTALDLINKNVCVVGLGVTGQSVLRFLRGKVECLNAFDEKLDNISHPLEGVNYYPGSIDDAIIINADLLVLSPGIPLTSHVVQIAKASGVPVIGDLTLYQWFNHKKTVAITGSNGKSTVTELVTAMLNASGISAMAGGNIGYPLLDMLDKQVEVNVLELSSFQLDLCPDFHSDVATVINISHDHMDRYASFDEYKASKLGLLNDAEQIVVNLDAPETLTGQPKFTDFSTSLSATQKGFGFECSSQTITYNGDAWIDFGACQLKGRHNVSNLQIAAALALAAGANLQAIKQVAFDFEGLAHRCQVVGVFDDVTWINDSKATNVAAAMAAIEGLRTEVKGRLYWLAGGVGKGADFSPLSALGKSAVAKSFLFGTDAEQLAKFSPNSQITDSMQAAMMAAKNEANAGDVVLLSPACASFDSFTSYQDRGNVFCQHVRELYSECH